MKKIEKYTKSDDAWISANFERLVDTYPGQFIVVANGEPFIGRNAKSLFKKARLKFPNTVPTCMTIPRKEALTGIL